MMDARYKIIMKKRSQLVDARDRIAQLHANTGQDARIKLDNIRNTRTRTNIRTRTKTISRPRTRYNKRSRQRQVDSVPITEYDQMINLDEEMPPASLMPIVRSIKNDLSRFSSPPVSRGIDRKPNNRNNRNFARTSQARRSGIDLNLKIVAKNTDLLSAGILKRSYRNDITVPTSILKKRQSNDSNRSGSSGYRILVSNLQSSVTAADIHELFGDIGELSDSRLVRPGTAEVIYGSLKDAQRAVDVYHNRQLDGQPMNCFLVNPRNPAPTSASARPLPSKSGGRVLPASSNSSVVPDVSTVHKVLFGN